MSQKVLATAMSDEKLAATESAEWQKLVELSKSTFTNEWDSCPHRSIINCTHRGHCTAAIEADGFDKSVQRNTGIELLRGSKLKWNKQSSELCCFKIVRHKL